jgi:recombinational DNA repair ATPase RecF
MLDKIKQIKLKKFRGATDETTIELDARKRMFVIFGENGTGKTTILDAIDFACNKNNEVSLKNKSVGLQKYKYLHSISSNSSSLEVEVETTNNAKCTAKFGNRGDIDVKSGLPTAKILRRDSILKIITGQPKERFDEIRDMVSYPKIKQIEDALREAQKVINKTYDEAIKAYQQEETNLNNSWQEVGDKTKEFLQWAKERAGVDKGRLSTENENWQKIWKKAEVYKTCSEKLSQCEKDLTKADEDLKQKNTDLQQKLKGESEKEGLVTLLEKAKTYIERQSAIAACPVCSNKIDKNTIVTEILSRIEQMKDLKKLQDEINVLSQRKTLLENQNKAEKQSFDKLADEIKALFPTAQDEGLSDSSVILGKVDEWTIVALEKQKEFNQLDLIQRSYKTYLEKKEEAEKSAKKVELTKKLLSELEALRKQKVDDVLKNISSIVERMYSMVHPNEGIGLVKFYLDPKKSESLEFDGNFQGDSVPPQAYYSESHLDTLGICVFLALSQYGRDDCLLLLDDVLTSVDQPHMNRLIEMLEAESKNFAQVIITTHYRPWRDRYRSPVQQSSEIELIELLPWTADSGVRHTRTKFYVDEIRESVVESPFDRQKVASKAGILLEHLLDEIVLKYALNVPRRPIQKYTLNELFFAIDAKTRKLLTVVKGTNASVSLQEALDSLHGALFVRNDVGCHYTETGALLGDGDVRDFGNQVINLADMLLCDSCGAFPNKNRTGSYWECGCGNLKLNPLQRSR